MKINNYDDKIFNDNLKITFTLWVEGIKWEFGLMWFEWKI